MADVKIKEINNNVKDFSQIFRDLNSKYKFVYDKMSKEDRSKVINDTYKYKDANTPTLKKLLGCMIVANNPIIAKGSIEKEEYKLTYDVWYFTKPTQLKIIFRDFITDHPHLSIQYKFTNLKLNPQMSVLGNVKVSLGECISVLENSDTIEWLF